MRQLVVGTAGHIDHGKTTLIKALTGIETDTTKEEQKRGLSINLGFAYLDLPNQQRVGIVDVPGHEKFIKNMIAGLPGLNLVLLVIDGNEGMMPQTKEHLDILTLLGITEFIIVLTKVATVESELKALVVADIQEQLAGTPLAQAPMIETDALTGQGIDALKLAIQEKAQAQAPSPSPLPARLNVDRVFSVKGFGTVVTGTLIEGVLAVGDQVVCLPKGLTTKIRTIQVHEQTVPQAVAGQRTALNLSNLKPEEIRRGDVLTTAGNLSLSWMLDAEVTCLASYERGLGLWERVRLLIGTQEVMARLVPIGSETIPAGASGFVQFRLEEQLAVKAGDRFIVRGYSPLVTIGGGLVLDSAPTKHRRFKETVVESLTVKAQGDHQELVLDFLQHHTPPLTSVVEISQGLALDKVMVKALLSELITTESVRCLGECYVTEARFAGLARQVMEVLQAYHKAHRLQRLMPIEECRSKLSSTLTPGDLSLVLKGLADDQKIILEKQGLKDAEFKIVLNPYHLAEKERMLSALSASQFLPLTEEALTQGDKNAQEVLPLMVETDLVYLTHETLISKRYLVEATKIVRALLATKGEMTIADFRNATNSSRKASMLILEYLDKQLVTKRVEDVRVLGANQA